MRFKINQNNYLNILMPVLAFILVFLLLFFVINGFKIILETNQANFTYTVKARDASEKIDIIVEKVEINLNIIADYLFETYEIRRLYDEAYNKNFLRSFSDLIKAALINSPGVQGSWFQLNIDVPFGSKAYCWYIIEDGKILNLKDYFVIKNDEDRTITPEDDPYYFEAIKNKKMTWSDIYTDYDIKEKMISISKPVYKNGILIGVVGIDITVENLNEALKLARAEFEDSDVFILNSQNEVILYQAKNIKNPNKDLNNLKKALKNQFKNEAPVIEFFQDGKFKTAIILKLSNKYKLVVAFPNSLIYKGFDTLLITVILINIIMIILFVMIIWHRIRITKINNQLKEEMRKLRTIFNVSPNVVIIKTAKGVYADCNKKFLEVMNLRREDVIGKTDEDLFDEEEVKKIKRSEDIARKTGEQAVSENSYGYGDNKIYVEEHIIPFYNNEGELIWFIVICFNITKQKEEQEILLKAKETAEKATVMKSNFLANMSHEIRTPLNGVLGFIQLLKETDTTSEQLEFINDVQKSSEILLNVLNDILDFSKIEAGKLSLENISFNVRSIIEDVTIMTLTNAKRKGLGVNSLICSDVPTHVFGDSNRIKQVLNNLVGNAIKFTKEGEVTIYVNLVSEDEENAMISFDVKDTGIGIPKDKLKLIFESFSQADASMTRKFGGTGLGLAISKELVELMGGNISVKSEAGKGSVFSFNLPFKKDNVAIEKNNNLLTSLNGAKILIVDNNPTDLKIIRYYLSEINCDIYEANSCQEALEIIEREYKNLSAIIVDCKVQEEAEKNFKDIIIKKQITKNIPVIVYCSLNKRVDYKRLQEQGLRACLVKPVKRQELFDKLAKIIDGEYEDYQKSFSDQIIYKKFPPDTKILVVEDSLLNCKLILKILENHGLTADLANNGREAVDAVKSKDYDLILMDYQMPILDGYRATEEIRKMESGTKHIPIIAMTANALSDDKLKCSQAGMDDYISKPIEIENLLDILDKYINKPKNKNEEFNIENIINEMMEELNFNKTEAIELFSDFLNVLPENFLKVEKNIEENNFEDLRKVAHKLKGSSANMRARNLSKLCAKLEKEAAKINKDECINLINKIKNEYDYVKSEFERMVNLT
ncbi:MAG: response regulator [Candidatus Gastranaerophilales bacterium]|nr:response regulator [Candidatus Gastranaerophilales bacterium]